MKFIFYCKVKQYLEEISALEMQKPIIKRRHIPTIKDIADEAGMHYTTVNRIVNNKVKKLDYATAGKIAKVLHNRGFVMKPSDILGVKMIEKEDGNKEYL